MSKDLKEMLAWAEKRANTSGFAAAASAYEAMAEELRMRIKELDSKASSASEDSSVEELVAGFKAAVNTCISTAKNPEQERKWKDVLDVLFHPAPQADRGGKVDHTSEDPKELDNLRDIRDINNYIIRECCHIAPKFKGVVMKAIDDLPHYTPRYSTTPSSEEGLREALKEYLNNDCPPIAWYSLTPEEKEYFKGVEVVQKAIANILSRHPYTDKCGELVKRLNLWYQGGINKLSCEKWDKEFYAILDEFSKAADGKEGK